MPNVLSSIPIRLLFALTPIMLAMSGCSTTESQKTMAVPSQFTSSVAYPAVDSTLGEKLYPNEHAIAEDISTIIAQSIRQEYAAGQARRDAHPKAHGCVRAEFQVSEQLPPSLAQGIFVPGKTYQAWIRFSNGSRDAEQADIKRDARGMAIKVMGVAGQKLLPDEQATQDFIMINHPVFFANDPARYKSLMQDVNSDSLLKKLHIPFALGIKGALIALNTNTKIADPVQTRYWSMVPYQLGIGDTRQAIKYSARACTPVKTSIPNHPSDNFLRETLKNNLQKSDACMEFLLQPRTSADLSVEDSMTEWKESQAPFYKVATIRIPQQVFDTPAQNEFCENLSFSPWHAVAEHKPLGVTNRLRKVIYDHISQVRHEMNSVSRVEPK